MNRIFFFILVLVLFFGCARKEEIAEVNAGDTTVAPEEETAAPKQDEAPEVIVAEGNIRANPFLTPEEEEVIQETGNAIPIDYLSLSAVLYSPKISRVVVNGQILNIGDSIDNKKVIKIEPEAVILKDAQGEYVVRLKEIAGE